ncbi:hypothetical protein ACE38V_13800 [Cytobacillus sp. Hz8]|uniref:hypothetical protein n=1 Tax=Cytobacillus sp. Hz8 TaxID=3347168 RepID=UPI0035DC822F
MGKKKIFLIGIAFISLFLSACSDEQNVNKMKEKNSLKLIFIQKVEGNETSEEMTKIVSDKTQIQKIISMVEELKVKESNNDIIIEKMQTQDNYMFSFYDRKTIQSGTEISYSFSVLNDGTFIFTHHDVGSIDTPRITTEKHVELLNDIKQQLDIHF